MRIESLEIHNYKVFKDVKIEKIPNFAVFVGKNGVGKTTLFDVFGFLHDCLQNNVRVALDRRGGFDEVISRDQSDYIGFVIKFRPEKDEPLVTYELKICLNNKKRPVVKQERLRFRRGSRGKPWLVLDFSNGEGRAIDGEIKTFDDAKDIDSRPEQKLDSPDILAIKGLGQFRESTAIASLRRLIEQWQIFNFHIDEARERRPAADSSILSSTGDNLSQVAKYIRDNYPEEFSIILARMKERIPGVIQVTAEETVDHYIVLQFQDGAFKNPFSARYVSDGTMKMFTYLTLLYNPERYALLCIEEPENQLYPELLCILAEEFRSYSQKGGQVFVSTHSPDFLDAIEPRELFILTKKDGFTTVRFAANDENIVSLIQAGDKLGSLWNQRVLMAEDNQ
ncbi:MAG: AAA family ATPase [Thermoguttaceae bacterium]|nr:AAA family ATPase [Thermoguttaceae bacterium]